MVQKKEDRMTTEREGERKIGQGWEKEGSKVRMVFEGSIADDDLKLWKRMRNCTTVSFRDPVMMHFQRAHFFRRRPGDGKQPGLFFSSFLHKVPPLPARPGNRRIPPAYFQVFGKRGVPPSPMTGTAPLEKTHKVIRTDPPRSFSLTETIWSPAVSLQWRSSGKRAFWRLH